MYAWKLIKDKLPTREKLRNIGIDINGDYHFCENQLEDINYLMNVVLFKIFGIQLLIAVIFLLKVSLISLIGLVILESVKRFIINCIIDLCKKIFVITWCISTCKNNVIVRNYYAQPGHIITKRLNCVKIWGIVMLYLESLNKMIVHVAIQIARTGVRSFAGYCPLMVG